MFVQTAIDLIDLIAYKPGWTFKASDLTKRFEGTVSVKITYPARKSEREEAPAGYPTEIEPYAEFPIIVTECADQNALYRCVLDAILVIEQHEAREFLRIRPTYWAPFHPHTVDGMKRYGTTQQDLAFGLT